MKLPRHQPSFNEPWSQYCRACLVCAYLNDILISGKSPQEHLRNLEEVLSRLEATTSEDSTPNVTLGIFTCISCPDPVPDWARPDPVQSATVHNAGLAHNLGGIPGVASILSIISGAECGRWLPPEGNQSHCAAKSLRKGPGPTTSWSPRYSEKEVPGRQYVWWPGLDADLEGRVSRCVPCQECRKSPPSVPLHPWEWPQRPWVRVHVDYAGPF